MKHKQNEVNKKKEEEKQTPREIEVKRQDKEELVCLKSRVILMKATVEKIKRNEINGHKRMKVYIHSINAYMSIFISYLSSTYVISLFIYQWRT